MSASLVPPGTFLVSDTTAESIEALMRLIGSISSIPSVKKVGVTRAGGQIDLWVLMREEAPEDEARIYLHERDYLGTPGTFAIGLHVIPLSRVTIEDLPDMVTILER